MFEEKNKISDVAQNILKKRYFKNGETTWKELVDRVVNHVCKDYEDEDAVELTREMMLNRYFIPNSPCLVNAGTKNNGLIACFVVDFPDSIEGIYKTKLDFALIAKKGGGCGTTLSKLRPENSSVEGSAHGYAGGPIKFYNTICHDMEAMTQAGFRQMAMMGTMSVYHPDIYKFLTSKENEGVMTTTNISVVVDNAFMDAVKNNPGKKHRVFHEQWGSGYLAKDPGSGKYHAFAGEEDDFSEEFCNHVLSVGELFNLIVEGAWRNGEPGILFYDRMNDSPYKYSNQEILATNPCLIGDTLIQTVEGEIKIKDLVGKEIDVYCQIDSDTLGISKAFNIIKTKENSELVRISTSRGDLVCTPDHLIFTKNRGYVKAIELTKKDKLVGLNRKMQGEKYKAISLTGTNSYIKEHRFVAGNYFDINGKDVHHKDGNTLNNKLSNLEVLDHTYHSSISNSGHEDWNEHDELGRFIRKETKKKKQQLKLDEYMTGLSLRILKIEKLPYTEDVYDMEVEKYHNFIANNLVVHNCGEQTLPMNGCCCLGSLDVSKFLGEGNAIDLRQLETAVRLGVKFLDAIHDVGSYPTLDTTVWAEENRPIGLGIMGLADYFLKRGVAYGSDKSLEELGFILSFIYRIAKDESESLGEEYGVPDACKVLPEPRRNVTLISIAPTGTISLLAGCNSGIEPIFSEITIRNDKTGSYSFVNDLAEKPYFRCAVSANGAQEVTWEEHVKTQAVAQEWTDAAVSKTINFPTNTHRDTIAKSFMLAWELGCKGLTVYRNNSRKVEVLSPKALKKDLCPVCKSDLIITEGCKKCSKCDWKMCEG